MADDLNLGNLLGLVIIGGVATKMVESGEQKHEEHEYYKQHHPSAKKSKKETVKRQRKSNYPFSDSNSPF